MYKFVAFAVLAVILAPTVSATFWRNCLGVLGPDHIETPLCDAERCFAVRGQPFVANVTLSSPDVHQELLVENIAFIFGIPVQLPVEPPHDNGCNQLYVNGVFHGCPTLPNVPHVWMINQDIPAFLPAFQNTVVRYTLSDRGTLVGCVEITATLV
jgi:hypothetical protein